MNEWMNEMIGMRKFLFTVVNLRSSAIKSKEIIFVLREQQRSLWRITSVMTRDGLKTYFVC